MRAKFHRWIATPIMRPPYVKTRRECICRRSKQKSLHRDFRSMRNEFPTYSDGRLDSFALCTVLCSNETSFSLKLPQSIDVVRVVIAVKYCLLESADQRYLINSSLTSYIYEPYMFALSDDKSNHCSKRFCCSFRISILRQNNCGQNSLHNTTHNTLHKHLRVHYNTSVINPQKACYKCLPFCTDDADE